MVLKRLLQVFIGVIAQFVIMPALAIFVARLFDLNPALAVGLLMLGSVPGGTASNVIAFLARGDVALSVTMTSVSTIVSPIMTPLLMMWLSGPETETDGAGMSWSLVRTVLLPVIIGLVPRVFLSRWLDRSCPCCRTFPSSVSVVSSSVRSSSTTCSATATGRLFRFPDPVNRTMDIEIGTQSAGLASGMAGRFFSPEAALPGAVAAVVHNITGAIYVGLVRNRPMKPDPAAKDVPATAAG